MGPRASVYNEARAPQFRPQRAQRRRGVYRAEHQVEVMNHALRNVPGQSLRMPRSRARITRHICTNIRVTVESLDRARGTTRVLLLAQARFALHT
jgi:hypothetical protein